jgi:hypothetical protein
MHQPVSMLDPLERMMRQRFVNPLFYFAGHDCLVTRLTKQPYCNRSSVPRNDGEIAGYRHENSRADRASIYGTGHKQAEGATADLSAQATSCHARKLSTG